MLEVRIEGVADLRKVAARIRAEGNKDLSRELAAGLRDATRPVQAAIREEYEQLPKRGGYAGVFSKSLRFRTDQRAGSNTARLVLRTYADGTKERRDINRLEKGVLRHPVFGRSRPGKRKGERIANPWAVTSVKGEFHKRGTENAADEAEREMIQVARNLAARLVR